MDTSMGVLAICTAYESGFGKGLQFGPDLPNPYKHGTVEYEAYAHGVEEGHWRRVAVDGDVARMDWVEEQAVALDRVSGGSWRITGPWPGCSLAATAREAIDTAMQMSAG